MKIEIKKSSKLVDYNVAIKYLEKRVNNVINGKKPELLWILEHTPVYTGGSSFKENEILNKKIRVIKTSRGGKVTYHGPGQKVIYFVINLSKRKKDIRSFIKCIEKCIIQVLKEFKIKSFSDRKNIGIWVKKKQETKKIASIGIRVKRWVAYHGFSININNDLNAYKNIIPCGIIGKKITNLTTQKKQSYNKINSLIVKHFLQIFKEF